MYVSLYGKKLILTDYMLTGRRYGVCACVRARPLKINSSLLLLLSSRQ